MVFRKEQLVTSLLLEKNLVIEEAKVIVKDADVKRYKKGVDAVMDLKNGCN